MPKGYVYFAYNYFAFNQPYLAEGKIASVVLLPNEAKKFIILDGQIRTASD